MYIYKIMQFVNLGCDCEEMSFKVKGEWYQ